MIRIVQPLQPQERAQPFHQSAQEGVAVLPGIVLEVTVVRELHEQQTQRTVDGASDDSRLRDEISQVVGRVFVNREGRFQSGENRQRVASQSQQVLRRGRLAPRRGARDQVRRRLERIRQFRPVFAVANAEDGDEDERQQIDSLVHHGSRHLVVHVDVAGRAVLAEHGRGDHRGEHEVRARAAARRRAREERIDRRAAKPAKHQEGNFFVRDQIAVAERLDNLVPSPGEHAPALGDSLGAHHRIRGRLDTFPRRLGEDVSLERGDLRGQVSDNLRPAVGDAAPSKPVKRGCESQHREVVEECVAVVQHQVRQPPLEQHERLVRVPTEQTQALYERQG